jgi:hypothetical protein
MTVSLYVIRSPWRHWPTDDGAAVPRVHDFLHFTPAGLRRSELQIAAGEVIIDAIKYYVHVRRLSIRLRASSRDACVLWNKLYVSTDYMRTGAILNSRGTFGGLH